MAKYFWGKSAFSIELMTPLDAAYIAGFVDGEGWIGISKVRRSRNALRCQYRASFEIANTNFAMLHWIQKTCGNGRIVQKRRVEGHKDLFVLRFVGNQIRNVLPQLRPYLRIKGVQADCVLEFLADSPVGTNLKPAQVVRRGELHEVTSGMNFRGVPH